MIPWSLAWIENRLWRKTLDAPGAAGKVGAILGAIFGTKVAVRFEYGAKISREAAPPERDAVVDVAVRELGFKIARVGTGYRHKKRR